MKTRHLSAIFALAASMTAALASAQTYSGTLTASDYTTGLNEWTPEINYSITYNSDKTLSVECTLSEFNNNNVQVNFEDTGNFLPMNMVDGNNLHYSLTTTSTYEEGTEFNSAFFYMAYPGKASRANFKYTVGSTNTTDTEAPVWSSDPTVTCSSTTAKVTAVATDDSTSALTYELSADSNFPSDATTTATGYSGKETTITLTELTPETAYTYYCRVKDASGNVSEVKTVSFTTSATPSVVATYYGVFQPSEWEEVASDTKPKLNWKAETLDGYDEVVVTATLGEALPDGATLKFCGFIEGGIGEVNGAMTATGNTNEYSINVSDLIGDKTLAKDQIFGQFFFRIYQSTGAVSRTKILAAVYKVGASNDPIDEDTTAPNWISNPAAQDVTDRSVVLVFNVNDDSGKALLTITGDNGFATISKQIAATGTEQSITVTGLSASTTYNLSFAVADLSGNECEKTMTLQFTTDTAQDLDVLYTRFSFKSENWKKNGDSNTFAPNGDILLAVNADNTVTATVKVESDGDLIDNSQFILHGIDTPSFTQSETNVFTATTTTAIADRTVQLAFHLNFVLKDGKGNSELNVLFFTPSNGSTSGVKTIDAEGVKVIACNGTIRVADGKQFAVYTIAGQQVYAGTEAANLSRGIYIVVVDGKATKVVL